MTEEIRVPPPPSGEAKAADARPPESSSSGAILSEAQPVPPSPSHKEEATRAHQEPQPVEQQAATFSAGERVQTAIDGQPTGVGNNNLVKQLADLQVQSLRMIEALHTDAKHQHRINRVGVGAAVAIAVIAFFAYKSQETTSADQSHRLGQLTTEVEGAFDVTMNKLDGISSDVAELASAGERLASQDAISKSVPPAITSISDQCGSVDLSRATVHFTNPRECDVLTVSLENRGIAAAKVRSALHIGGIYNLACDPLEPVQLIAPQRTGTFLFYVGACLSTYTSSHTEPATATVQFTYE